MATGKKMLFSMILVITMQQMYITTQRYIKKILYIL